MAQKPVLPGEVGCACGAREVSVERGGMGERRYLNLYRRYLNCIFNIEGIYFSSLHPINIEALCLKHLAIRALIA